MKATTKTITKKLEKIVSDNYESVKSFTFEPSRSDEKDFPFTNLAKWNIHKMLIDAYELGRKNR